MVPIVKALNRIEHNLKVYNAKTQKAIKQIQDIVSLTSSNIEKADELFPRVFD